MITEPLHTLDHLRKSFNGATSRADRSKIGQFLTPVAIARFMSSMFETGPQEMRVLDPGTGAGALSATFVETLISRMNRPLSIEVVANETSGNRTYFNISSYINNMEYILRLIVAGKPL